jgi:cardiolipin synthase
MREQRMAVSQLIRTKGRALLEPYVARPDLPPQFQQAVKLAEKLGDFPILAGNHVELISDYETSLDRLVGDIEKAAHHVHLLYYIFADDRTGTRVIHAMAQAVKRGVQCRVLFDSLGSKAWRRGLMHKLQAVGVEAVPLLPVQWLRRQRPRMDLRNHRKIALVDGRVAYIGSQNLVNADFKPGIVYKELVARVTGPVVWQLQAVLLSDYYLETGRELNEPEYFPPLPAAGTVNAQALPSGPGYETSNNQRLIVSLVHAAQKQIVLTTPYFVPDDALLQALQCAVLRGVDVVLVVSRKADQLLVGFAQRSYYEPLLEAGIKVFEYTPGLLHAKHLSIDDDVALVGSSNIDIRSFQLNAEIMLLAYDAGVTAALRAEEARNLAQCEPLKLDEWRRRPFLLKVLQNLARLFDSLL